MLKLSNLVLFVISYFTVIGQSWTWTELDTMPMRTSNNAVVEAVVGGNEFVYSFGGIDTSKVYSGIHSRSFKYDVNAGSWSEIDSLPDQPKIASAASFVNDKIYILGGYYVDSGGAETSSNKLHVYNPLLEIFEPDGAPIPVPIDDHVQCVYKDSLIFVVTGWTTSGFVPDVQIYNPSFNQWQVGTSTPNTAFFTAFGASGYIIGDTLYYHGGTAGGGFNAKKYMRKGFINPNDPTDITWELMADAPGDPGYRSACSGIENTVFWVGGANTSYNFDGIAYNGGQGVDPSPRVLHYNNSVNSYNDETNQPYGVMDLRGIAKLSNHNWIICGGMDTNQVVSNRTFLLTNSSVKLVEHGSISFIVKDKGEFIEIETKGRSEAKLIDNSGRVIISFKKNNKFMLLREAYSDGIYFFQQGKERIRIRL